VLPRDFYATAEQVAGGFGPDVLTLRGLQPDPSGPGAGGMLVRAKPEATHTVRRARWWCGTSAATRWWR
jgi:hypothetical protein